MEWLLNKNIMNEENIKETYDNRICSSNDRDFGSNRVCGVNHRY